MTLVNLMIDSPQLFNPLARLNDSLFQVGIFGTIFFSIIKLNRISKTLIYVVLICIVMLRRIWLKRILLIKRNIVLFIRKLSAKWIAKFFSSLYARHLFHHVCILLMIWIESLSTISHQPCILISSIWYSFLSRLFLLELFYEVCRILEITMFRY